MFKRLRDFLRWSRCRFVGHPAYPTGRGYAQLYEVCCDRCYRRFVANPDPQFDGVLLPVDDYFEQMMKEYSEYLSRA